MSTKNESRDVMTRASDLFEELVGVVQGGWVGSLDPAGFMFKGERDMKDGKICLRAVGHASLTDSQWQRWVLGSLMRAGALADVAQKIWDAGVFLQDLTSFGSVGRANKPYSAGMVMFLDDVLLHAENLGLHPAVAADFQKSIADKKMMAIDLMHQLRDANPIAGKGIAQTAGDSLYKKDTVTGYGSF